MRENDDVRIDFLGLHAFVAIAARDSFQLAAAHLNLSQTAMSHRMRKLEDDLGVKLLQRTTREVSLTPAGLALLPKVKGTIDNLSASLEDLRRAGRVHQETLAIGCLPTIAAGLLPVALAKFRVEHPDVVIQIHDKSASDIASLTESGAIEFGITLVASHRWDFDVQPLSKDPFMLVCRTEAPLARKNAVSWSELAGVPLIRISTHTGNRLLIDDALGSRREHMNWRYEAQYVNTAMALVRAGLGMTVVPKFAMVAEDARGLRAIPLRNPSVSRQIGIISKRSAAVSPLAAQLRRLIAHEFSARSTQRKVRA